MRRVAARTMFNNRAIARRRRRTAPRLLMLLLIIGALAGCQPAPPQPIAEPTLTFVPTSTDMPRPASATPAPTPTVPQRSPITPTPQLQPTPTTNAASAPTLAALPLLAINVGAHSSTLYNCRRQGFVPGQVLTASYPYPKQICS